MAKKEQFQDALEAQRLKREAQLLNTQVNSDELLLRARRYVEEYEAEVAKDLPEAQEALTQIILPWWEDLKPLLSGLDPRADLLVFKPSEYLYPRHAYQSLAEDFAPNERSVVPETWTSYFWIDQRGGPRLRARRIPEGAGVSFGWISQRYEVVIAPGEECVGLHRLYPKAVLELAEAIQSGQIWDNLTEALNR